VLKRDLFQPLLSGYDFCRFDAINQIVDGAHEAAAIGLGHPALIRFGRRIMPDDECHPDDALAYLSEARAAVIERLTLLEEMLTAGLQLYEPSRRTYCRLLERAACRWSCGTDAPRRRTVCGH